MDINRRQFFASSMGILGFKILDKPIIKKNSKLENFPCEAWHDNEGNIWIYKIYIPEKKVYFEIAIADDPLVQNELYIDYIYQKQPL